MSTFVQRAVDQAADIKFARIALTVLAAPFYVIGVLVGAVVVVAVVAFGAAKLGVADVRGKVQPTGSPSSDEST